MEKGKQVLATPEQIASIKENLAFMCKSGAGCKKILHLIKEILNAHKSVIHVNVSDIQNFLSSHGKGNRQTVAHRFSSMCCL